jgi:hypothetical protein
MISKWIYTVWEGVGLINLAEDRAKWHIVVNAVMNLQVHKVKGISWLAE